MRDLKVKKLRDNARIDPPFYLGDAGYDIYSTIDVTLRPLERINIPLGLALEFDNAHVCLVQGKSGLANKSGLDTIGNVIDSSYKGEIHAQIVNVSNKKVMLTRGMKIAQLIFVSIETPEIVFVDDISESDRGLKGFGSSGK